MLSSLAFGVLTLSSAINAEPVVFEPTGQWQGNDGPWSTFNVQVGEPAQTIAVLPVPYRNALVVVGPEACPTDPQFASCGQDRGGTYNRTASSTWQNVDSMKWDPTESVVLPPTRKNSANGNNMVQPGSTAPNGPVSMHKFGYDQIKGLPGKNGTASWQVPNQGILSLTGMYPFIGMMGLGTKFSGTSKNPTSFFDNVRIANNLKSVSWSYTAGSNRRRSDQAPGSLVFGGHDASRFHPNTAIKCAMHAGQRPLGIEVGDITVNDPLQPGPQTIQLSSRFIADIDFTTPFITLPEQVTSGLERMLDLTWDAANSFYRVNETRHRELLDSKTNITLPIFGDGGKKYEFRIQYKHLVLEAKFPTVNTPTKFFAVQRAPQTQAIFTLGRAFLQVAHVTAVFDDPAGPYISVAKAKYKKNVPRQIVEIVTTKEPTSHAGMIAGIVIAILVLLAIAGYLIFAKKMRRFPFRAAPAPKRRIGNEEDGKNFSSFSTSAPSHSAPRSPPRPVLGNSRQSQRSAESVYYEAMEPASKHSLDHKHSLQDMKR
ncbi:acid protease [Microthyrium microscopicum]|uniref:Acid protease n=1 Tax=Microthyrium microscopicum TaxID=703497 RepID=A0A6A6UUL1_9PEZI|nr:acid protease [Microthyrium microscopicum]